MPLSWTFCLLSHTGFFSFSSIMPLLLDKTTSEIYFVLFYQNTFKDNRKIRCCEVIQKFFPILQCICQRLNLIKKKKGIFALKDLEFWKFQVWQYQKYNQNDHCRSSLHFPAFVFLPKVLILPISAKFVIFFFKEENILHKKYHNKTSILVDLSKLTNSTNQHSTYFNQSL